LDRLRDTDGGGSRTLRENTARLADSVLTNLRRLLNSRNGIAPMDLDYGIPDLVDAIHNLPDATTDIRKAIKTAIERYEPRLRRVTVKAVENPADPLALHFEISAEVISEEEKASVWIETRVDSSGYVEMKG
jgi:type VI secretion system protein